MKQFKRMILASTLMVGLAGFAVSCKYGDDIDEIRKDIESLRTGQVASVESQLSSLQATVSNLSSAKDALQSTVSGLESQLDALKSQLSDLKNSAATAEDVAAVEAKVAAVEAKIADLEKEIAALKSADAVLEEKIAKINETLKDFVTMDDLKATLASYATLDDVAQAVGVVQAALSNYIESNDAALAAAVAELKAAIAKAQEEVEAVAGKVFEDMFQERFNAAVEAAKLVNAEELQNAIDAFDAEITKYITKAIEENNGAVTEAVAKQISEELANFKKTVDEILSTVVTSVELYYSYTAENADNLWRENLVFTSVLEKDNVFEEGINAPIEFKEGEQNQTSVKFVVRVSPVNAQLTPEMISFVNSNGGTLNEIVEVTNVAPFETLLTRAGETGLWTVEAQIKENSYEKESFEKATVVYDKNKKPHYILYAVQVNNTKDYAERYVTSTYDLAFGWKEFKGANNLDFTVSDAVNGVWKVADINNRFDANSISLEYFGEYDGDMYEELAWKGAADTEIIPLEKKDKANVKVDDPDDNRSDKAVYPAIQALGFDVTVVDPDNQIRAMYVTFDYKVNAIESAPSEWNAWTSYEIGGMDTVVDFADVTGDKKIHLDFDNAGKAIHDIIGFRVFAVNYDGTLVDPDGKAFYVSLGLEGEDWNAVKTVVTPTKQLTGTDDDEISAKKDLAIETAVNKNDISEFTWVTKDVVRNVKWNKGVDGKYVESDYSPKTRVYYGDDETETEPLFHVEFYNAKNEKIFVTNGEETKVDFSKVAYIKTFVNPEIIRKPETAGVTWASFEDGKEYVGTLTLKDDTGHVLATLNVSMTKVLPDVPAGFSIKTNQGPDQGKPWNAFLIPTVNEKDDPKAEGEGGASWAATTANYGTMDLTDLVNFGEGDVENYVFKFAASQYAANGKDIEAKVVKAAPDENPILSVAAEFIDHEISHATTVGYDFGYISSVTKKDSNELEPWIATAAEFETYYFDIYNDTKELGYTWAWTSGTATGTSVTYGDGNTTAKNGVYEVPLASIKGTSQKDSRYNVAKLGDPKMGYENSVKIVDAHLYTKARYDKGELIEEYFKFDGNTNTTTLKFECISDDTNVTGDVECTLVITFVDMYGDVVDSDDPDAVSDKDPDGVHNHTIELKVTIKKR